MNTHMDNDDNYNNVFDDAHNYNDSESIESVTDFDDMNLNENLLRGIYGYGFERPSEIQQKGIPLICKGGDVIVQSKSGTGKTGTFIVSILNRIDSTVNECQSVVLVPTRELAIQVQNVCKDIGCYMNVHPIVCVGGSSIDDNRKDLEVKKPKIIIATPGRLLDIINRRYFNPSSVRNIVMDEADELLSDGFVDQIRSILRELSKNCQICLFSATMSEQVRQITQKFMINPIRILLKEEEVSLEGIKQFYIVLDSEESKYETFKDLFGMLTVSQTIVYVNSKRAADDLTSRLLRDNYPVASIHSQMSPSERSSVMRNFRNLKFKVLIATDLIARGIDVQNVAIVINYEVPHKNLESYIHRIGRSGRFGRKGTAINLVLRREYESLTNICTKYGAIINQFPDSYTDF